MAVNNNNKYIVYSILFVCLYDNVITDDVVVVNPASGDTAPLVVNNDNGTVPNTHGAYETTNNTHPTTITPPQTLPTSPAKLTTQMLPHTPAPNNVSQTTTNISTSATLNPGDSNNNNNATIDANKTTQTGTGNFTDHVEYAEYIINEYEKNSDGFNILHLSRYVFFKAYMTGRRFVDLLTVMHIHVVYTTLMTIYSICCTYIIYNLKKKSTATISEIAMDHFYQIRGKGTTGGGGVDRRKSESVRNIVKV